MRCDPGLSLDTFYTCNFLLLPLVTPFGSTVSGKGNPNIASIGHSVLGNPKVRYDIGFSIAFCLHKCMSMLLPLFITPFGVAVGDNGMLTLLTLISPYSEKPKVRHVSGFNLGYFT